MNKTKIFFYFEQKAIVAFLCNRKALLKLSNSNNFKPNSKTFN